MRLIDAEALKEHKYHSDITHENAVSVAQIDWMPTIQAVPIEVLQEIRAELTKHYVDPYNRNAFRYTTVSLLDVLDLIDKHIKEYTE